MLKNTGVNAESLQFRRWRPQRCTETCQADRERWGRRECRARGACGWFMGTVVSSAVGKSWKKDAPTATHLVEYKEKETRTKKLVGKAATELSADKYGAAEWWLLLEPVEC